MILFVSLSAKLPDIKIEDCSWFRFTGKRALPIENDEYESEVEELDIYGITHIKDKFYLILKSDPDYVFPLAAKQVRSLLSRSKGYTGTVNNIKVTTKKNLVQSKPAIAPNPEAKNKPTLYEVEHVPKRGEDTTLTKAIRKAKIENAKDLKFLSTVVLPTGVQYFYYGANIDSTDPTWEDRIEDAVLETIPKGYVVGASMMKHNGKTIPVVIIVDGEL